MGVIAVMRMIEERDGDFVMRPLVSRFGLLLDFNSQIPPSLGCTIVTRLIDVCMLYSASSCVFMVACIQLLLRTCPP